MKQGILALDQGTTSTRAIVFSSDWDIIASAQQEFTQYYPHSGWVEHDPEEIWQSVDAVMKAAIAQAESAGYRVAAIGVTNQRETTLVWSRETGEPVYPAIVWQDRRTAERCAALRDKPEVLSSLRRKTGLLLDPYFSASKIEWILDHAEGARARAEQGELLFGTIDSYLIWRMSGRQRHVTDATNAARTNLFNIHEQVWDEELLSLFNVPANMLPEVLDCAAEFCVTEADWLGQAIPVLGVAGDQHAAAIGQACFKPGSVKSTYGTGCFVVQNTGDQAVLSENNLLTTVCYRLNGEVSYALEGSIFMSGATVQWLRDGLGTIEHASQTEADALQLSDNGGVYLVPAFTGLGAPHWDAEAKAAIFGMTRDTRAAHFSRAALESVAYQSHDLVQAMHQDGAEAGILRVDGGMVNNGWLMQFMADVLDLPVDRPVITETTALGAAGLAALQLGMFDSLSALEESWKLDQRFTPSMDAKQREGLLAGWDDAVSRTLTHRR